MFVFARHRIDLHDAKTQSAAMLAQDHQGSYSRHSLSHPAEPVPAPSCAAVAQNMEVFVAVLLALKRLLAPVSYDPQAAAEAGQELTPKLAALGLVCPPAAAVTAAVSLKH